VLIEPYLVRFPLHLEHQPGDRMHVAVGGVNHELRVVERIQDTDAAYGLIMKGGSAFQIPGVKSLAKKLLSVDGLSAIKTVIATDPQTGHQAMLPFRFELHMRQPFASPQAMITGRAALCAMGMTPVPFLGPGKCGTVISAKIAGKEHLIGMYAGQSARSSCYVFSVPSVEEYNQLTPVIVGVSHSFEEVVEAPFCVSEKARHGRTIFLPTNLISRFGPPSKAPNQLSGGLTTIASCLDNALPIDQVKGKHMIFGGAFAALFPNDIKAPVFTKKQIEARHPEKIPPDLKGNLHAENVRLSKATFNVAGPGHPSHPYARKMTAVAATFGDYWKQQLAGVTYRSLTKEEGIWGNGRGIDAMDRNTATGAAFQLLFPGLDKKEKLFGERGLFLGEAGQYVSTMIDLQWEYWKQGKEILIPTAYTLKNELLPEAKVWKKRVVNVCDPITVVNLRRLFFPFQKAFQTLGSKSPIQVEMNPHVAYDGLAKKLSQYEKLYDADFSAYDLTLPATVLQSAGIALGHIAGAGTTLRTMINTAINTINSAPSLAGTTLFSRDAGMPSGVPCTSFLDGLCAALIVYFSFQDIWDWNVSPEDYYAVAWSYSCGDDTVVASSEPGFTGDDVQLFASEVLGMTMTDSAKDVDAGVAEKQLTDVSFCSRTFMRLPGHTRLFVGRIKEESIMGALTYSKSNCPIEQVEAVKLWAVDVALHGPELYLEFSIVAREVGLDLGLPRYKQLMLELAEGIEAAHANEIFNPKSFRIAIPVTQLPPVKLLPLSYLEVRQSYSSHQHGTVMPTTQSAIALGVKRALFDAPTLAEVPISVVRAAYHDLRDGAVYSAPYLNLTGETMEVVLPQQIDSPCFWKQIASVLLQEPPSWVNLLGEGAGKLPRTKRYKNTLVYTEIARAFVSGDFSRFKETVKSHIPDVSHGSEEPAGMSTAQPPTTVVAAAPSLGNVNVNPVGVSTDPMASTAISDVVDIHPTSGATKPSVVVEPVGGITPDSMGQTGCGFNLLTLAGKKIFKRVHVINVGLAEGTVCFALKVNPWNQELLNPHALAWADLHDRFYGSLDIHIQVVSCATIMGNLKIAYIPPLYSHLAYDQANLDAFNPMEFACNVNGEGTIKCIPMVEENVVTGIYKKSNLDSFGTIVCIAATNIENAYTTQVGVQIKVACSLGEDAIYDIPNTLGTAAEAATVDAKLDLGDGFESLTLAADGYHTGTTNYSEALHALDNSISSELVAGTTQVEGAWYCEGANIGSPAHFISGHEALLVDDGTFDPSEDYASNVEQARSDLSSTESSYSTENYYATWRARNMTDTGTISVSNMLGHNRIHWVAAKSHSSTTGAFSVSSGALEKYEAQNQPKLYSGPGGTVKTFNPMVWGGSQVDTHGSPGNWQSVYFIDRLMRLDLANSLPIATSTDDLGAFCPTNYYVCKLAGQGDIIPSVIANLRGQSILNGSPHVTACWRAVQHIRQQGAASLVTDFTDSAGTVVCQVIRNTHGMFIRRTTLGPYTNMDLEFTSLSQRHYVSSQEYPLVIPPADGAFLSRTTSAFSSARLGDMVVSGPVPQTFFTRLPTSSRKVRQAPPYGVSHATALAVEAGEGHIAGRSGSGNGGIIGGSIGGATTKAVGGWIGTAIQGKVDRKNMATQGKQTRLNLDYQGLIDRKNYVAKGQQTRQTVKAQAKAQGDVSKALQLQQQKFTRQQQKIYMNNKALAGIAPVGQSL